MRNTFFARSPLRLNARGLKRLGLAVAAVLLVALPRLTDLGGYLIVDEADRWRWAEAFYRALIAGDLRAMLVGDGYPGIVPVWLETIWLLGESLRRSIVLGRWFGEEGVYLLFHIWSRTAYLAQQRLPIALFNGLMALSVGWYAGKVYGRRVGLIALVLIALNPFYLADSRVNRAEAVITGQLTLSILFLIRYGQTRQYRWLIVSGLMGGFSFLTKIQGVVVLPAVGAILLFFQLTVDPHPSPLPDRERERTLSSRLLFAIRDGLSWALVAVLIWVISWPAMWVRPLDVLTLVFNYTTRKAGSEGVNLFFMGRHFYNEDPGPFFYPVVALLRMSPVTLVGLVVASWGAIRSLRARLPFSPAFSRQEVAPLLIYVLLYAGIMTVGSHKQDRYLMPVFLAFDILAAMGWVYLWDQLGQQWRRLHTGHWAAAAFASLLVVQIVSVLPYHPYYFPFFNPLLGDGSVGARTLRVGWGEGMDQVADYLNTKPDAADLTVATRWSQYMPNFVGKTLSFDQSGQWTQANYVVLYIQQTQRMLDPSPGIIRYFQTRQPEHAVRINGIEYALIYPSPFTRPAQPQVSVIPGQAALFGYRWEDSTSPRARTIRHLRVIWENEGLTQPPLLMAALTDGDTVQAWQPCQIAPAFEAAARTPGEVAESVCDLSLVTELLPPGAFDVRFGLADGDGHVEAFLFPQGWRSAIKGEDGSWRPAQWSESLDQIAQHQVSPAAMPADVTYQGQIRLLAYELSNTALQPGQPLVITLYWQALAPIEEDYIVFDHLFGLDGVVIGETDESPAVPTSHWLPGQVISTTHRMPTDPSVPTPALATLDVGLYNADHRALPATDRHGQPVPVALTRLKFVPEAWPSQPPPVVNDDLFGDRLLLKGHTPLEAVAVPGSTFNLQLWWQARSPVDTDYTVFVHLLDAAGTVVAQADGVPVGGRYPTSVWEPGEQIIDSRQVALPADLPGGEYRLIAGLYSPVDGSRLPLTGHEADFVLLGQLSIKP